MSKSNTTKKATSAKKTAEVATQEQTANKLESVFTGIAINNIAVSANNPRKTIDADSIRELAKSMEEVGLLQPISVRYDDAEKSYIIIAGERRFHAAISLGWQTIPCMVLQIDEGNAMTLTLIENLQRKDVHPMEEAVGFLNLTRTNAMSVKEIAARVGKSETFVHSRLKLNDLCEAARKIFMLDHINLTSAQRLCLLIIEDQEHYLEQQYRQRYFTIENYEIRRYSTKLEDAIFDIHDATLTPAGACTKCPFNSACQNKLFDEVTEDASCLKTECFAEKTEIAQKAILQDALTDPDLILISTSYGKPELEDTPFADMNVNILTRNDYEALEEPTPIDLDDYDMEDEYDVAQLAEHQKEYEEELEQYNKDLPNAVTALVAIGSDQFSKIKIVLTERVKESGENASSGNDNVKQSAEEKEIERLTTKEERNVELDGNKLWKALRATEINAISHAINITEELRQSEKKAVRLAIYNSVNKFRHEESLKAMGFEITGDVTDEQMNMMLRYFFLDTLPPAEVFHGIESNRNAAATLEVLMDYAPERIDMIKADFAEKIEKRKSRLNEKLVPLEKIIAERKAAEQTDDAQEPKTEPKPKKRGKKK